MGYQKHSKLSDNLSLVNYNQVIPNSHFWTDLNQLVSVLDVNFPDREYLEIGLNNTIKNGYELMPIKNSVILPIDSEIFMSLNEILEYVKSKKYNDKVFYVMLNTTIMMGFNLYNKLKLQRMDVYKRIDSEREYQDRRWNMNLRPGDVPDEEKPVSEWINYIEFHLNKAKEANYHLDKESSLAELRKVAALAVRAMEIHGCPEREIINNVNLKYNQGVTYRDGCSGVYIED